MYPGKLEEPDREETEIVSREGLILHENISLFLSE
jgi:hypothetical protein